MACAVGDPTSAEAVEMVQVPKSEKANARAFEAPLVRHGMLKCERG